MTAVCCSCVTRVALQSLLMNEAELAGPSRLDVQVGTKVKVMPSGEEATVKSIEAGGHPAQLARAGDSVDVALAGVDAQLLSTGEQLWQASISPIAVLWVTASQP